MGFGCEWVRTLYRNRASMQSDMKEVKKSFLFEKKRIQHIFEEQTQSGGVIDK